MTKPRLAERYAGFVIRWRVWIVLASIGVAIGGAWLVKSLPVRSDFSSLLPPDAPSVVDLNKLQKRSKSISTVILMVESDDPVKRENAARAMYERAQKLPPELVSKVSFDQRVEREFIWNNRWLFASLDDLQLARDELKKQIKEAKLKANPLYIDLDDGPKAIRSTDGALDRRLAEAREKHEDSGERVSRDGRCQNIILTVAFPSGDGERGKQLLDELFRIRDEVRAGLPAGVDVGVAGDMVVDRAEHATILDGMVVAILVTTVLVLLVLMLFFRSPIAVGGLMWSLVVGCIITFAYTRLTIGELNIATAFLSSIVVGNGMNFGIVVGARYLEERRNGADLETSMARTLRHTFTGTAAAAATAAVAYGSLIVTDFRGFRHFGVIGGAGMIACWLTAFSVLPAAFAMVDKWGWLHPRKEPAIGRILMKLVPRRLGVVAAVIGVIVLAAGVETWRYFTEQPFENNFRNLRSQSEAAREEAKWMKLSNWSFGRGVSAGFVVAVNDRKDVAPLVDKLRKHDEGKQPKQRLFAMVTSIDDMLPADQGAKLAILDEIRGMLTPEVLGWDPLESTCRHASLSIL